jgi:hypothetical protein
MKLAILQRKCERMVSPFLKLWTMQALQPENGSKKNTERRKEGSP